MSLDPDFIIIDDLEDTQELRWFDSTLRSRRMEHGRFVWFGTRLHEPDVYAQVWAGELQASFLAFRMEHFTGDEYQADLDRLDEISALLEETAERLRDT